MWRKGGVHVALFTLSFEGRFFPTPASHQIRPVAHQSLLFYTHSFALRAGASLRLVLRVLFWTLTIIVVVIDVSFISAGKILPPASIIAKSGADLLILVKPQFELPREDVGAGGIVDDPALHEKAVEKVRTCLLYTSRCV